MSTSRTSRSVSFVLTLLLGATGALLATAVAKAPPAEAASKNEGSTDAAECVAVPVPFVHNPTNIKPGGRGGQTLPDGWKPAGGAVLDGRPIVIACR
ncbi:MAG TPA: hypothetical protein DFR83_00300 [Deltaproteobacteria bacterium]|nr:hypothetical protein [Deltaproteobacteria bacterium]